MDFDLEQAVPQDVQCGVYVDETGVHIDDTNDNEEQQLRSVIRWFIDLDVEERNQIGDDVAHGIGILP